MRVIVCGGRDFSDEEFLFSKLDEFGVTFLIEGGAKGADTLAWRWANRRLAPDQLMRFEADWSRHGRAAGPMRNQLMIEQGKPDAVIAFEGGRGTADMIRRAQRAGIPVTCYKKERD